MKCARCDHDSKFKERSDGRCPKCKQPFAFEPQKGDPVTDMLFKNAIEAVSGKGRIKWGVEHLYYEVVRRKRSRPWSPMITVPLVIFACLLAYEAITTFGAPRPRRSGTPVWPIFALIVAAIMLGVGLRKLMTTPLVALPQPTFERLWQRWCAVHGMPATAIRRNPESERVRREIRPRPAYLDPLPSERAAFGRRGPPGAVPSVGRFGASTAAASAAYTPGFGRRGADLPPLEPDIADYSFDRAVIVDRARTADLLIANNFHFENNCAVLSYDGYPDGVFDTVKAMIRRNPRIHVFTLHDATPEGLRLANAIAHAPDWFAGRTLVVDLGLRPRHVERKSPLPRWLPFAAMSRGPVEAFHGLLKPAASASVTTEPGIDAAEARWLSQYNLELAALRPEDILKRLFNGIKAHDNDDTSGGGTSDCGSFDSSSGGGSGDDHGGDSFG